MTSGDVYKNARVKVYSDGSTNTIVCRSAIFKDKDIYSSARMARLKMEETLSIDRGSALRYFLRENGLHICERGENLDETFYYLMKHPQNEYLDNFLECVGLSKSEWFDFCRPYLSRSGSTENTVLAAPRDDSLKRAKDSIFDYVMCNSFEYFFTGTINPELIDSKNPVELLTPVQQWLKDMVRRYGLKYVMVAERHKKGGIHFHGCFVSDKPLKLVDSGTALYKGKKKPVSDDRAEKLGLKDGRRVYNLKTWGFGFSTCIKITGDVLNTAFYITKYLTKDNAKIFGNFYWHSRNLKKPNIIYKDIDFDDIKSKDFGGYKYIFERGKEK